MFLKGEFFTVGRSWSRHCVLTVVRGEVGDERLLIFGEVLPGFATAATLGSELKRHRLIAAHRGNGTENADRPRQVFKYLSVSNHISLKRAHAQGEIISGASNQVDYHADYPLLENWIVAGIISWTKFTYTSHGPTAVGLIVPKIGGRSNALIICLPKVQGFVHNRASLIVHATDPSPRAPFISSSTSRCSFYLSDHAFNAPMYHSLSISSKHAFFPLASSVPRMVR